MKTQMSNCKACGQEMAKGAKNCPHCGAKNPKPIYKKWWFWLIVFVVVAAIGGATGTSDDEGAANVDTSVNDEITDNKDNSSETTKNITGNKTDATEPAKKTTYYVGDVYEDVTTKITFVSSGDYIEENPYLQPEDGNKYIYLQFVVENISKNTDISIGVYDFECYADGYAASAYYSGNNTLSATLSVGRATSGYIYFEVPANAESIDVEYEVNILTNKKIKFVFEGNKDSGYVYEPSSSSSDSAYSVGDLVESSRLKIKYLSCEEYISDNIFVVPADGYRFVSCEFEFENIGSSDEYISSYDFDCYADGVACESTYIRDDNLSATLSAGRKTKGTVTFEVPINAEVVEVEYLSNYWTSNRVVFTVK